MDRHNGIQKLSNIIFSNSILPADSEFNIRIRTKGQIIDFWLYVGLLCKSLRFSEICVLKLFFLFYLIWNFFILSLESNNIFF